MHNIITIINITSHQTSMVVLEPGGKRIIGITGIKI